MKKFITTALAIAMVSVSGCATIISGSTQTITIKSVPEDATIFIVNKAGEKVHSGNTPATVTLKRGAGYFKPAKYEVTLAKSGFQTKTVEITAKVNGWYIGNILFGGILGILAIDPATGAMYSLSPDNISATLEANPNTAVSFNKTERSLTVMLVRDVPVDALKNAQYLGTI